MSAIFSLDGKALLTRSGNAEPFLTVKAYEIPKAGVYTLEGPNGSGKSMFIRFLTGTLPGAIEQNFGASLYINGNLAKVYSYRDAVKQGIVSVFQDDDLISSMTVFENIILRHGTSTFEKLGHYIWSLIFENVVSPLTSQLRILGPAVSAKLQTLVDLLEPPKIDWKGRTLLRKRATELLEQHGVPAKILDEMPARLSGGGRAAAKLVCAQLYNNTKILLLDEAFNGVEIGVWPRFVDGLKAWAQEKGTVIVAVTHSSDELVHWDPLARFDIRDGVFVIEEQFLDGVRRQAAPPRQLSSPVFELAARYPEKHASLYIALWALLGPGSEMIAIVDESDRSPSIVEALYRYIPSGYLQRTLAFSTADLQSLDVVIGKLERFNPQSHAVIVLAGGRDLRMMCSIALQVTQNLRLRGIVVAPNTFGDAIEAILAHSVTASIGPGSPASKAVTVRTSFSPEAFVIPLDSLEKMGSPERKDVLVRCIRLGLLFDQPLYRVVREGLSHSYVETAFALDVLRRSVSVLNEMADLSPQSLGIGRVAQFGDAHAAMIEQITSGKVHGGHALLLGMMLEATLSHSMEIGTELRQIAIYLGITFPSELLDHTNWAKISAFYDETLTSLIDGERHLTNLAVRAVGQFSVQAFRERLASSPGRQNRSLAKFANLQAEGALQQCTLHKLQIAIRELSIVFAEGSSAYSAAPTSSPSSHQQLSQQGSA